MPKVRKRKLPIVQTERNVSASSSKPEVTRSVIREFHVLLKKQTQLQKKVQHTQPKDAATLRELADIGKRIEELGGLERYQHMSAIGQKDDRGGGSHKILIGWMKELGLNKMRGHGKLRLLEVGALRPDNYQSCSAWIQNFPIDLNSRHPTIVEQDFLLLNPQENKGKWSAISLSLVLNFVPEPKDRGRMLQLAHEMLVPDGHLFVALPLPCLSNSRYLSFERFRSLMSAIGFSQLREKCRQGGKMVYYLYTKQPPTSIPSPLALSTFAKKQVVKEGPRNNFSILLSPEYTVDLCP